MPLKINLDDLGPEEEEPFSSEGVRVGSLLVSAQGIRAATGAPACVLSPQDLVMVPESEGGFLGKGSSGAVWQAVNRRTGERVAVKEMKVTSQAHLTEIRRELETLYDSSAQASAHIVDFYGAYTFEGSVFMAVECMDGTLADLPKPVPLDVLAHMMRSVLRGLQYLHRTRHLIHRDLKPSNVLFKRATGDVKLSDFGVSSNLECTKGDAHSFVGTVTYMSPERLRGDSYSYAADVWSLGLVVAELALGACPYPGLRSDSVEGRFWALLQHLSSDSPALELPDSTDAQLADFISACVAKTPENRPTCTSLLAHPFITERCGNSKGDCGGDLSVRELSGASVMGNDYGEGNTGTAAAAVVSAADVADRHAIRTWLAPMCVACRRWPGHCLDTNASASPTVVAGSGGDLHVPQTSTSAAAGDTACPGCSPALTSASGDAVGLTSPSQMWAHAHLNSQRHDSHPSSPARSQTSWLDGSGAVMCGGCDGAMGGVGGGCGGRCHFAAQAEPPVDLDEELDKLLL